MVDHGEDTPDVAVASCRCCTLDRARPRTQRQIDDRRLDRSTYVPPERALVRHSNYTPISFLEQTHETHRHCKCHDAAAPSGA
jgi:hypothetical protein